MPRKKGFTKEEKPLRRRRTRRILSALLVLMLLFYLAGMPKNGENPHHLAPFNRQKAETLATLTRVDEGGSLYAMTCASDYYTLESRGVLAALRILPAIGCTAFTTLDESGHLLTGRNFDYPHLDRAGNAISLSVVLSCAPEGKYRSVGIADALLFREAALPYAPGTLDDGKTDVSLMLLLPWLTMDGLNEKGLSVSILYVDVKDGETAVKQAVPGREKVIIMQLARYILDSCADVGEAIAFAQSVNLVNTLGNDYHLFVSDETGRSVVLEWRHNTLTVTETNAATNFYLGYDDAADCYYPDGTLHERFPGKAQTARTYHYGYGHGYARFNTVVSALDGRDSLSREEAFDLLRATQQTHDAAIPASSQTMYSVLYDNTACTLSVFLPSDPSVPYDFSLNP